MDVNRNRSSPKLDCGLLRYFTFFVGGGIYLFIFFLVPWSPGPLIPCCPGHLVPFISSPHCLFPWFSGPLIVWSPGCLVPWSPRPLVPCSSGLLVPWSSVLFRFFLLTCLLPCFTISFMYSLCPVFVSLAVLVLFLCCWSFHAFQYVDFFYFHSLYFFCFISALFYLFLFHFLCLFVFLFGLLSSLFTF